MAEMESLRLERRKKGLNEEEAPGTVFGCVVIVVMFFLEKEGQFGSRDYLVRQKFLGWKQNQPLVAKGRPVLHIGTEEVLAGRITKHGTEWNCIDIPLISIHWDRENATCSSYMYVF